MKFKITYWDCGDKRRTAEVEALSEDEAVELLVNDENHPLAQVDRVEVVEEG